MLLSNNLGTFLKYYTCKISETFRYILFYPPSCLGGKWIDLVFIFHPKSGQIRFSCHQWDSMTGYTSTIGVSNVTTVNWIEKKISPGNRNLTEICQTPKTSACCCSEYFPIKLPIPLSRKDVIVIWLVCEYFFNSLSPPKKYSLFKICIIIYIIKIICSTKVSMQKTYK